MARLEQSGGIGSRGEEKKPRSGRFWPNRREILFQVYLRFSYGAELGKTELSLCLEFQGQKPLGFSPTSSDFFKFKPKLRAAARAPCEQCFEGHFV